MSKAAKQSIFILIFLLIGALILAGIFAVKAQKAQDENKTLKKQTADAVSVKKEKIKEVAKLKKNIKKIETEKVDLQKQATEAITKSDDLSAKMDSVVSERDTLVGRIENIKKERDELVSRIQELTTQGIMLGKQQETSSLGSGSEDFVLDEGLIDDDEYWAKVLRDKASLQIKMDNLKQNLSQNSISMVDLKQLNADLQIELDALKHSRGEVERDMQHKESLINNLSLELARTKNDKKFTANRVAKLNEENSGLRRQLKELFTTKSGLEKTIVKLQQDKKAYERRIHETDSLIQSKIDEIWEIKESLDRTFKSTSLAPSASRGVELPAITINSNTLSQPVEDKQESDMLPGYNGTVVSVNADNNFVIVDIGEKTGLRLGDMLSVYRNSQYIARLEVIQVRKDIAAADIKDQWSKVVVGDTVK